MSNELYQSRPITIVIAHLSNETWHGQCFLRLCNLTPLSEAEDKVGRKDLNKPDHYQGTNINTATLVWKTKAQTMELFSCRQIDIWYVKL